MVRFDADRKGRRPYQLPHTKEGIVIGSLMLKIIQINSRQNTRDCEGIVKKHSLSQPASRIVVRKREVFSMIYRSGHLN